MVIFVFSLCLVYVLASADLVLTKKEGIMDWCPGVVFTHEREVFCKIPEDDNLTLNDDPATYKFDYGDFDGVKRHMLTGISAEENRSILRLVKESGSRRRVTLRTLNNDNMQYVMRFVMALYKDLDKIKQNVLNHLEDYFGREYDFFVSVSNKDSDAFSQLYAMSYANDYSIVHNYFGMKMYVIWSKKSSSGCSIYGNVRGFWNMQAGYAFLKADNPESAENFGIKMAQALKDSGVKSFVIVGFIGKKTEQRVIYNCRSNKCHFEELYCGTGTWCKQMSMAGMVIC